MGFTYVRRNGPTLVVLEGLTDVISGTVESLVELGYILFVKNIMKKLLEKKRRI